MKEAICAAIYFFTFHLMREKLVQNAESLIKIVYHCLRSMIYYLNDYYSGFDHFADDLITSKQRLTIWTYLRFLTSLSRLTSTSSLTRSMPCLWDLKNKSIQNIIGVVNIDRLFSWETIQGVKEMFSNLLLHVFMYSCIQYLLMHVKNLKSLSIFIQSAFASKSNKLSASIGALEVKLTALLGNQERPTN